MPKTKEPTQSGSTKQESARDIFHIVLHAPNRKSLHEFLRKKTLDLGAIRSLPDTQELAVDMFVNKGQIAYLKKTGWKFDVQENLSEVGRRRQLEVGKGDRFEGGKKPPKGLGKKTGKEE